MAPNEVENVEGSTPRFLLDVCGLGFRCFRPHPLVFETVCDSGVLLIILPSAHFVALGQKVINQRYLVLRYSNHHIF